MSEYKHTCMIRGDGGRTIRAVLDRIAAEQGLKAALAWRDFMVSSYSDAGQERWLADHGIDLLRGTGRLAGTGAVEVDGVRHTAEHVVVATGSDPITPPIAGLRELEGVWGTREATSMKAVPRRLLVLGGGSAGVELAQVVRRLGGEAVIVEGNFDLGAMQAVEGQCQRTFLHVAGIFLGGGDQIQLIATLSGTRVGDAITYTPPPGFGPSGRITHRIVWIGSTES